MMKEIGRIVTDSKGTEKPIYPGTSPNLPIQGEGEIKRPTFTTYEEALEWNKQAQKHTESAISFTQEYAKRIVEPQYGNRIMVVNVSDVHWGHFDVDYDYVDQLFNLIEKTPDTYCIFGWNLLDAAIPAQFPDGVMWSGQTAQEQVYTFRDKLRRLDGLHKILGAIGDSRCHESWMKRKTGWMIYRELFEGIDIPLLLNGGYLDVQVKNEKYRMGLFHNVKYWSQFNKTHGGDRAMDRLVDAEIVFTSHLHQAATGQSQRYNPPFTKETAVVSSGTCKLHDKFTRGMMGADGEKGGQAIILWADKHKFNTVFDLEVGSEMMFDMVRAKNLEELAKVREAIKNL